MSCDCDTGKIRITIVGAAGRVGQPLSLLLKRSKKIPELVLFDITDTEQMAMDLSVIDSPTRVFHYSGKKNAKEALKDATIIILLASARLESNITREAFFDANAKIAKEIAETMAEVAPKAILLVFSNPVNSLVPLVSEVMKKAGKLDTRKILGVSTLDLVRASNFVAEAKGLNPEEVKVPVVGGHSSATMVPLLSQTKPSLKFTDEELETITKRIINAGPEVVRAHDGTRSATLSSAHAINRLVSCLIDALSGKANVVEYAIVRSGVCEAKYCGSALLLGKQGFDSVLDFGPVTEREQKMIDRMIPAMKDEIKKGEDFILKGKRG